jgi:hypothetical protein
VTALAVLAKLITWAMVIGGYVYLLQVTRHWYRHRRRPAPVRPCPHHLHATPCGNRSGVKR